MVNSWGLSTKRCGSQTLYLSCPPWTLSTPIWLDNPLGGLDNDNYIFCDFSRQKTPPLESILGLFPGIRNNTLWVYWWTGYVGLPSHTIECDPKVSFNLRRLQQSVHFLLLWSIVSRRIWGFWLFPSIAHLKQLIFTSKLLFMKLGNRLGGLS